VLTPTVSYPFSPLLVILNTFGPTTLVALAALLLGIWNVAPLGVASDTTSSPNRAITPAPEALKKGQGRVATLATVRAALGTSQYVCGAAAWQRGQCGVAEGAPDGLEGVRAAVYA
jgi:hypothetical protein